MNFATAGTGGIMGWCVVHPFNTLSIRLNLASMNTNNGPVPSQSRPSSIALIRNIIQQDGIKSLYHGLSAGIVRQICFSTLWIAYCGDVQCY